MQILPEQYDIMRSAIAAAQISITEFSKLCRVSRITLYRWWKIKPDNDRLVDKNRFYDAYNIAVRLNNAVILGKLPLVDGIERKTRLGYIKTAIRDTPAVLHQ